MFDELNPPASPCYPRPPWNYTHASIVNIVCRASRPAAFAKWIPEPLQPSTDDGVFVMFFLHVPEIPEFGPHYNSTECGLLVPVQTGDGSVVGATFAIMFVDNDQALAGGREIWGYPKKLGSVTLNRSGDHITVDCAHMPFRDGEGASIFSAEIDLDDGNDQLWEQVGGLEPRILRRAIPDPYEPVAQSVELLKVVHTLREVHEVRTGSAKAQLSKTDERLDEWGEIETLGATLRVCDFVLPYAQRL